MSMEPPEMEEGVCVACRAATAEKFCFPGEMIVSACAECQEDGSLCNWLAESLEKMAEAEGWAFTMGPDGQKFWTPPPMEEPL